MSESSGITSAEGIPQLAVMPRGFSSIASDRVSPSVAILEPLYRYEPSMLERAICARKCKCK